MTFTLHHGDCLEVMAGMEAGSIDFIFTDPPYGHNNNDGDLISRREAALGVPPSGEATRPIANDGPEEAAGLLREALPHFRRLLKAGCCCCCCCCCGGGGPDPQCARWSLAIDRELEFKQMVVWDKGPMGMGWHYRRSYEIVLVAMKAGGPCRWYDESGRVENIIRPNHKGIHKIIPSADEHPTPKPVELVKHFLQLHTKPGDVVLDPFMGGGSTGVACVELGRHFIGVELDERWFENARARIEAAAAQMRLPV